MNRTKRGSLHKRNMHIFTSEYQMENPVLGLLSARNVVASSFKIDYHSSWVNPIKKCIKKLKSKFSKECSVQDK